MLVDTFVLGVSNNMLSEKTKRKGIQKLSCDNYNGKWHRLQSNITTMRKSKPKKFMRKICKKKAYLHIQLSIRSLLYPAIL